MNFDRIKNKNFKSMSQKIIGLGNSSKAIKIEAINKKLLLLIGKDY